MSDLNINIQEVINDLAEQVKRLTIDNAVLRSAIAAKNAEHQPAPQPEPHVTDE